MALSYTVITGTFEDGQGNPLSGTASFTPNVTVYASGIPVLTAGVPITAQITGGQLLAATGGAFQLLASDNSGLGFEGLTGFLIYEVQVTVGGQELDPWSFALPSSPSPVELYALANTGSGGGGGGSGTVTSVAVATANGLAGTVANPTSTPAITLRTTVTGVLKGNGTAISAATSGTDYAPPTSGSAILKGDGAGGFANAASGTDYAPATSGSSILKGNGSGGFSNASAGTDYLAPAGNGSQLTGIGVSQVSGAAPLASPTFTGTVTVPATVNATDAAQKAYVDAVAAGLSIKSSVRVATTGAETFTISAGSVTQIAGTAVDGVSPAVNDRILVKDAPAASGGGSAGSTQPGNGIYVVTANSVNLSLSRATDMSGSNAPAGAFAFTEAGTANAGAGFVVTTPSSNAGFTYGTNSIAWTQFSGAGEITAGTGLAKTGNTISLSNPVTIALGGTGQATQQAALDALAGAVTSGQVLRGNGTHVQLAALQASDVPTLNQNTTGTAANFTGAATIPARIAPHVATLTDGASVALDASLGNVFRWSLGAGSHTLAAPSNPVDGQMIRVRIIYGGSFTPLFNAAYEFGTDGQPSWSAASGKIDEVGFSYDADANAGSGAWTCSGWKLGYS
jgi:hypothetical protein